MEYPRYSYPSRLIFSLIRDWLLLRPRHFADDARACVARLKPPLRVLGAEYIPQRGPCVLTFNHYYRPGFHAWWLALAIAAVVPADIHFVMTAELTFPGRWYARLGMLLSRFVLARAARMYDFTTMPPMPPRQREVEARAESVRKVLEVARREKGVILGLAPEGGDAPDGVLTPPASGLGRFCLLLSAAGLKYTPVGAYEEDGEFCLRFGSAYELRVPHGLSSDEKDEVAATIIMNNIAKLLPLRLQGEFRGSAVSYLPR